ncbi:MAG: DUF2207 domain-containing protein [Mycoplasmatota bacterium]
MNIIKKNIIYFGIVLISFFTFNYSVLANSIYDIEMDIYIDENGDAFVTETWNTYLTTGTEGYRAFSDLKDSNITNFIVTDDNNFTYELVSYWNTSNSFEEKSYKNGYNYISNGVELCWGISNYGSNTYILEYEISNIVTNYTDYQGIYFNFLNISQNVDNAKIVIQSYFDLSSANSQIWAFGYEGNILFEENTVILSTNNGLMSSDYMVGLLKFEDNYFNSTSDSTQSFDEVYEEATSPSVEDPMTVMRMIMFVIFIFLSFIPYYVLYLIFSKSFKKGGSLSLLSKLDFSPKGNCLPKNNINYWREVPMYEDIECLYWIANKYNISTYTQLSSNIIGVYLLKLVLDKKIIIEKESTTFFSKNKFKIYLKAKYTEKNDSANSLLLILNNVLGNDNYISSKKLKKWCKRNSSQIMNWNQKILLNAQLKLEQKNMITTHTIEKVKLLHITQKVSKVSVDVYDEALKLLGLKKFLDEISLIKDKSYIEVHMWEKYLIVAQLLGVADKVEKEFSSLYPNYFENSGIQESVRSVSYVSDFTYHSYHVSQSSSSSSGSGGSSSRSGGGSSRGSSGGGFR